MILLDTIVHETMLLAYLHDDCTKMNDLHGTHTVAKLSDLEAELAAFISFSEHEGGSERLVQIKHAVRDIKNGRGYCSARKILVPRTKSAKERLTRARNMIGCFEALERLGVKSPT